MYEPIQIRNPRTLEMERQQHEARNEAKFVHKDVGMILGKLIAYRSCRITLGPTVLENPLKTDINEMAVDLGVHTLYLAAHGSIQRQDTRKPFTHKPPLEEVVNFVEERGQDGLIVIYGTDYTNRSEDGNLESLAYLTEIANQPHAPMICTLGHGYYNPDEAQPGPSTDFLNELRTSETVGPNGIYETE